MSKERVACVFRRELKAMIHVESGSGPWKASQRLTSMARSQVSTDAVRTAPARSAGRLESRPGLCLVKPGFRFGFAADILDRASCGSPVQWRKHLGLPAGAHED